MHRHISSHPLTQPETVQSFLALSTEECDQLLDEGHIEDARFATLHNPSGKIVLHKTVVGGKPRYHLISGEQTVFSGRF